MKFRAAITEPRRLFFELDDEASYQEPIVVPERNLVAAFFERYLRDLGYMHKDDRREGIYRYRSEALEWLQSDSEDAWGFVWCCEVLEVSPGKVRGSLGEVLKL